jgi:hypothetical protein
MPAQACNALRATTQAPATRPDFMTCINSWTLENLVALFN